MRFLIVLAAMAVPSSIGEGSKDHRLGYLRQTAQGREFCGTIRKWKAIMRVKHPDDDRSIPGVSLLCNQPDD